MPFGIIIHMDIQATERLDFLKNGDDMCMLKKLINYKK